MGAKFYKYDVKGGGARSECSERSLWGSGGLAPLQPFTGGAHAHPRPPPPVCATGVITFESYLIK